jgi:hypothetical protein
MPSLPLALPTLPPPVPPPAASTLEVAASVIDRSKLLIMFIVVTFMIVVPSVRLLRICRVIAVIIIWSKGFVFDRDR